MLDDFTIKFDMSSPIRWSNPAGTTPALYDPENNPSGIQHAVIDTGDSNPNTNITIYSLQQSDDLRSPGVRRFIVYEPPEPACADMEIRRINTSASRTWI